MRESVITTFRRSRTWIARASPGTASLDTTTSAAHPECGRIPMAAGCMVSRATLTLGYFVRGLVIVEQVLIAVHRQAAGEGGTGEAGAMPGLFGSVHDIALVGDEDGQRSDLILHFAHENEPEFG